jgi:hypothetical protein
MSISDTKSIDEMNGINKTLQSLIMSGSGSELAKLEPETNKKVTKKKKGYFQQFLGCFKGISIMKINSGVFHHKKLEYIPLWASIFSFFILIILSIFFVKQFNLLNEISSINQFKISTMNANQKGLGKI